MYKVTPRAYKTPKGERAHNCHVLTCIGMKVELLLLNTSIIDDGQEMEGSVRCAHRQLLRVLLGIPVKTTELDTCNKAERK